VAVTTEPKGNLVTPVGFNPDGELRPFNVDAAGNLLTSAGGAGVTNEKARIYLGTNQTLTHNTWTLLNLDTENYDPASRYNTTTHKFVIATAGYYLVLINIFYLGATVVANKQAAAAIYVNGSRTTENLFHSALADHLSLPVHDIFHYAVSDEIQAYGYHYFGGNATVASGTSATFMCVHLLSVD